MEMLLLMSGYIVIVFLVSFIIFKAMKIPNEYLYKFDSSEYYKNKISEKIASGQAVEIKPNKKLAIKHGVLDLAIFLLVGFPVILSALIFKRYILSGCGVYFGLYGDYIATIGFLFGFPFLLLVGSILNFKNAIETIKTGFYPPLSSVSFKTQIAKKGFFSKIIGYSQLSLIPIFILMIPMAWKMYSHIYKGNSIEKIQYNYSVQCSKPNLTIK